MFRLRTWCGAAACWLLGALVLPVVRWCILTPLSRAGGAYLIGKRVGFGKEAFKPHNLPMVFTGTAILYIRLVLDLTRVLRGANEIAALAFVVYRGGDAAAILGVDYRRVDATR